MLRINTLSGFGRRGSSGDTDALAFFAAAGISDAGQKTAVTNLVTALKGYAIWTKMLALYPFVGGTSSSHSYNLKNVAAYQITWAGTVTHDSNGVTGNGSDGYGDTNLNGNSLLSLNNTHMSVYSRTATNTNAEMGSYSNDFANRFQVATSVGGNARSVMYQASTTGIISSANATQRGFVIGSRRSSTDHELYLNGSSLTSESGTNVNTIPNVTITLLATNREGASRHDFVAKNLAFASIGSGLTDTEAANFHTAVEAYQDALSRGVV